MRKKLHPAGKIVKAVGLKGDIKIYPLIFDFEEVVSRGSLSVGSETDSVRDIKMIPVARSGMLLRYRIDGNATREDAEKLVGQLIFTQLAPNELPSEELVGFEVITTDGEQIGELIEVLHMPAHDVYVINWNQNEILIPGVEEIVKKVDFEEKMITIFPMEGLLDQ